MTPTDPPKKRRKARTRKPKFSVPVGSVRYDVYVVPPGECHPPGDDDLCSGVCNYPERKILVSDDLGPGITATLWHEWLHAALYELGFPTDADRENLIEALAQAIVAVRRDTNRM